MLTLKGPSKKIAHRKVAKIAEFLIFMVFVSW